MPYTMYDADAFKREFGEPAPLNYFVSEEKNAALGCLFFCIDLDGDYSPRALRLNATAFVYWFNLVTDGSMPIEPEDLVRDWTFRKERQYANDQM